MAVAEQITVAVPEISDGEFQLIQALVKAETGIALSEQKRTLVTARLGKRLRALGLRSFLEYYEHLTADPAGAEREQFINAITTNKTDFYRERAHFEFVREELIPAWKTRALRTGERRVRIWSAGCSTGEEAYTLAIELSEGLGSLLTWDVRILASDIDTSVLAHASAGIYARDRAVDIPAEILHRYFLRGTGERAEYVQVRRELRTQIVFRAINLLDEPWPIRAEFDCIFCRNVMIYFDRPTQRRLTERFAGLLRPDGLLFLGHSESLFGVSTQFRQVRNTIYAKAEDAAGGLRRAGDGA